MSETSSGEREQRFEEHRKLTHILITAREEAVANGLSDVEVSSIVLQELSARHPELRDIVLDNESKKG